MSSEKERFIRSLQNSELVSVEKLQALEQELAPASNWKEAAEEFVASVPDTLDAVDLAMTTTLKGYEIVEEIGRGSMSIVYRIRNLERDIDEALKYLPASKIVQKSRLPDGGEIEDNQGLARRFEQEVENSNRLKSLFQKGQSKDASNIGMPFPVLFSNWETIHGGKCYTMELLRGADLNDLVIESSPLSLDQALQCIRTVANTLGKIHNGGYVHRDVKPSNIFISENEPRFRLLDFGLMKWKDSAPDNEEQELQSRHLTGQRGIETIGTLAYSSKEQISNPSLIDASNDVYSLGCVFYFLVTGKHAFPDARSVATARHAHGSERPILTAENTHSNFHLISEVNLLLQRMIAVDQNYRFKDGNEVAAAIDTLLGESGFLSIESELRDLPRDELAEYLAYLRDSQLAKAKMPLVRPDPNQVLRTKEVFVPIAIRRLASEESSGQESGSEKSKPTKEFDIKIKTLGESISNFRTTVLVGPPGGGKTTLLKRTALSLAEGNSKDIDGWFSRADETDDMGSPVHANSAPFSLIPIFIQLRTFATFLQERSSKSAEQPSIIDFLEHMYGHKRDHSKANDINQRFFDRLIGSGGCCFFLDGLDEVSDSVRTTIAKSVVDLINKYRNASVPLERLKINDLYENPNRDREKWLTTNQALSKRLSATDRSSNGDGTETAGRPHSDAKHFLRENIFVISSRPKGFESVARNFSNLQYSLNEVVPLEFSSAIKLVANVLSFVETDFEERQRDVDGLSNAINGSRELMVLAGNPMFCTSLVLVYKFRQATLPDRRVDVFDEIVKLLLGYWKASERDSRLDDLIEERAKILGFVAYQMQISSENRTEISAELLLDYLQSWYCENKLLEKDDARKAAKDFLNYAHERSGLLVEMEPGSYAFTHEGFREYFAAFFLVDTGIIFNSEKLPGFIDNADWEQVLLLAAAHPRPPSFLKEQLIGHCLTLVESKSIETKTTKPKQRRLRRLSMLGKITADMGGSLSVMAKESVKKRLKNEISVKNNSAEIRIEMAILHDALSWNEISAVDFFPIGTQVFLSRFPVTNRQFSRFLNHLKEDAKAKEDSQTEKDPSNLYWNSAICRDPMGQYADISKEASQWYLENKKNLLPKYWSDSKFGTAVPNLPVVGVSWYEANAYCNWLQANWKDLEESELFKDVAQVRVRLPRPTEWSNAITKRFSSNGTTDEMDLNIGGRFNRTTPVWMFGAKENEVNFSDLVGNVWQWQSSFSDHSELAMSICGGSYSTEIFDTFDIEDFWGNREPSYRESNIGFRILVETDTV